MWPSMTFEVILDLMKSLRLHNSSIHTNHYQNRFINERFKLKRMEFFVRCRGTYDFNDIQAKTLVSE